MRRSNASYWRQKRALDLLIVLLSLVFAVPACAMVGALVRLKLGSPVLFGQVRPGYHGRPFTLWKFRTMREAYDADGAPLPDEQRLGRFGRFLRSTSLDELPSLLNVVRGEMSLVGPRPLLPEYLPLYSAEQARRHDVLPGLTGLAQIAGRNALPWPERLRLDVAYVERWSLSLDLRILLRTVGMVLQARGVSQKGRATVDRFRGDDPEPEQS